MPFTFSPSDHTPLTNLEEGGLEGMKNGKRGGGRPGRSSPGRLWVISTSNARPKKMVHVGVGRTLNVQVAAAYSVESLVQSLVRATWGHDQTVKESFDFLP